MIDHRAFKARVFFREGPVYRCSAHRGFAQPLIWGVLPAHSSWRCSLGASTLDVAPGRYLLVGYLNAWPATRPGPIMFRRYVEVEPAP